MFVSVKQMDKTCPKATLSANRFIALSLNTGLFLCEVLYKKSPSHKAVSVSRDPEAGETGSTQIFALLLLFFFILNRFNIMSAEIAGQTCVSPDCGKPAKLQCPTCLKQGISGSFFCSQDCFKKNWVC